MLVLLFAASAAGCETALRPFQHAAPPGEGELGAPGRDSAGVEVKLRGGPRGAADAMARLTAAALLAQGVPAAPAPALNQGFTLEGLVTRADTPGAFTAVQIHWTLRARDGRWAGAHEQDVRGVWGGWRDASPPMLSAAARAAARAAAELVLEAAPETAPESESAMWGVWTAPVAGPDDESSAALRRALGPALRLALIAAGAPVRDEKAGAAAVIQGRAEVTPGAPGADDTGGGLRVTIMWQVLNAAGESVGKAEQQNTLPLGSAPGSPPGSPPGGWGETAALAAAAVADTLRDFARRAR